jgi:hypothetical protein
VLDAYLPGKVVVDRNWYFGRGLADTVPGEVEAIYDGGSKNHYCCQHIEDLKMENYFRGRVPTRCVISDKIESSFKSKEFLCMDA